MLDRGEQAQVANLRVLEETLVRAPDGHRVPASQLLRQPGTGLKELAELLPTGGSRVEIELADRAVDIASVEMFVPLLAGGSVFFPGAPERHGGLPRRRSLRPADAR